MSQRSRKIKSCASCGQPFHPWAERADSGKGRFCSRSCGARSSQLETDYNAYLLDKSRRASSGCLEWVGSRDQNSYGRAYVNNERIKAHRLAYRTWVGPIDDIQVLHKCDNPPCIEPSHLFPGDPAANSADKIAKGRLRVGRMPGESNPFAKLTATGIAKIIADNRPQRAIARAFGIAQSHVGRIKRGESWKHLNNKENQ